jgi:hypothetical protein
MYQDVSNLIGNFTRFFADGQAYQYVREERRMSPRLHTVKELADEFRQFYE